jgi:PAS domain S-box-containing protein
MKLETEYYLQILHNLNIGIIILSDTTIEYVNSYFAQLFSYKPDELLNTEISQYIHPNDLKILQSSKYKGQTSTLQRNIRGISRDGEIISFKMHVKQIKMNNDNRQILLLEKVVHEPSTAEQTELTSTDLEYTIDQLKLESTLIRREKHQIELILNNISDGVIVLDQDGKTLTVNYAAKRILNQILSFEITDDFNFILSSGHIFFDTIRKLYLSNDLYQREVIEVTPEVFIEFTVALNSSAKQNSLVTIVEFRDISAFIRFDNLRKKFVSVVSHELRTPISALNLALINLQRYGSKLSAGQKRELINSMGRSASVLNQQVDDLLILSRFDAGKGLNLKWEKYHLLGTIYSVLAQLEPRIAEKNISIRVTGAREIELLGDIHRIEQILRIILDNAIKYSDERSSILIAILDPNEVDYNPRKKPGVLIKIIDQGIGISEKDLPHIFTRFYRADDVAHIQGTGIGLALAKELVQLHQGEIQVESEYKKGSTFIIFFPLLQNPPKSNPKTKKW